MANETEKKSFAAHYAVLVILIVLVVFLSFEIISLKRRRISLGLKVRAPIILSAYSSRSSSENMPALPQAENSSQSTSSGEVAPLF